MCTNYRAGSRDFIARRFGTAPAFDYAAEAYPTSAMPIVRRRGGANECVQACFGLVPHWARDARSARNTVNARAETVAAKPSFRRAWRLGQLCLVPMASFYEPNYESGRSVRWRIERADAAEFAVAGIWDAWRAPDDRDLVSFSLLTINAEADPLMCRFHAPGHEKRTIVIVDPADDACWLDGDPARARELLHGFAAADYHAVPDPRPGARAA